MADQQTTTTPDTPAPEGQAQPQGSTPQANPAPVAGEDAAALKAQLDQLSKWKSEAEADLKKYRDARKAAEEKAAAEKAEFEKQLREQGKFAELAKTYEDKAKALEAQLAESSAKASQFDEIAQTMKERVSAAKAKGDLPSYLVKALDAAPNPASALDILDDFRAEQAKAGTPAKQPAPPAPATGAPPAASHVRPIDLANPTVADLQTLKAQDPEKFRALIYGQSQTPAQSLQARLIGGGRKQ